MQANLSKLLLTQFGYFFSRCATQNRNHYWLIIYTLLPNQSILQIQVIKYNSVNPDVHTNVLHLTLSNKFLLVRNNRFSKNGLDEQIQLNHLYNQWT